MVAIAITKPIKFVISSKGFYSLNKAKEKIMEYYSNDKLDPDAMIYEVQKTFKPVIVSEVKTMEVK